MISQKSDCGAGRDFDESDYLDFCGRKRLCSVVKQPGASCL